MARLPGAWQRPAQAIAVMLERALTGRLCAGFSNAGATSLFMRFPGVATSVAVGGDGKRHRGLGGNSRDFAQRSEACRGGFGI